MPDESLDPRQFARSFHGFMESMRSSTPTAEAPVYAKLREFLGGDPAGMTVHAEELEVSELPNLHLAIGAAQAAEGASAQVFGVQTRFQGLRSSLSELCHAGAGDATIVPPRFKQVEVGGGEVRSCLVSGLVLLDRSGDRTVLRVSGLGDANPFRERLALEVLSADPDRSRDLLAELRETMRRRSVYRGRVISVGGDGMRTGVSVNFHELPTIARDGIVLPDGLLDRIERHVDAATTHRDSLLAAGRHLKRGILLHGPPGTGKTLTAMYLAKRLEGRTVLLLSGQALGLLARTCALARILQPSLVIIEDVDLIAEERTGQRSCGPLLFELLNQMDGLAADVDVTFLLTTNRPDRLEPALAARPGRIDLALEVPLPGPAELVRLLDLYARGMQLECADPEGLARRIAGASGAFVKELLRKAAVLAAPDGDPITVRDVHVDEALRELVLAGGALTRRLLGAGDPAGDAAGG